MMQELYFKLGIPTQFLTIYSDVPTAATNKIPITTILPTQIGRIIGISVYTDTTSPTGNTLITTANATNLYLLLKKGSNNFVENLRLDDINYNITGQTSSPTNMRYLPVNIPYDISMDQSYYINPTNIIPAPGGTLQIALNLWFIDKVNLKVLQDKKIIA